MRQLEVNTELERQAVSAAAECQKSLKEASAQVLKANKEAKESVQMNQSLQKQLAET